MWEVKEKAKEMEKEIPNLPALKEKKKEMQKQKKKEMLKLKVMEKEK